MNELLTEIYSERDDRDIGILVTYRAYDYERGRRDSLGVPEEPDNPAHIDIETIINAATGLTFDPTLHEYDDIYNECFREAFDD